jgi:hypothetical protein
MRLPFFPDARGLSDAPFAFDGSIARENESGFLKIGFAGNGLHFVIIPRHTFSKIKTAVAMSPENHDPAFRAFRFPASGTFLLVRIILDNFRAISLWTVNCERSTANLYPRSSPHGFS